MKALRFAHSISMGFKSGEYGGKKSSIILLLLENFMLA
jgi:hypothetical protein